MRRLLVDELGIEPGTALRDLERQILRQSAALDAAAAAAGTRRPWSSATCPPCPRRWSDGPTTSPPSAGCSTSSRLVTLVGPAGVGKTRTALEAARALHPAGGVWLVRLEVADAATSIPQLVSEALQLTGGEQALLDRFAGAETVLRPGQLRARRRRRRRRWPPGCSTAPPPLRILATSQAPLGVDGEAVYALDPLPLADSVTLFADRAARMRRRFVLDDDTAATVEAVCRSLDGLPLAIELAAARVRSLSVQEIARRLDDRFALLQDPTSRRPERRRALAAAIAWSYDLLFPDDQRGLWALSCFSGGAPLAAAEHVLTALGVPGSSAVDVIDRLADRSLSASRPPRTAPPATGCLTASALRRRPPRGGGPGRRRRRRPRRLVRRGRRAVRRHRPRPGPARLPCPGPRRAGQHRHRPGLGRRPRPGARPAPGQRVRLDLGGARRRRRRGRPGPQRARGGPDHATARDQATGLLLAGWLEASAGNVEPGPGRPRRRPGRSPNGSATTACGPTPSGTWRSCGSSRAAPRTSWSAARPAWPSYRRLGLPWETAASLLLGAFGSIMLGDTVSATAAATEAVRHLTPIGDSWGLVHAEAMLGAVANAEHRFADAAAALTRAAELLRAARVRRPGRAAPDDPRPRPATVRRPDQAADTLARAIQAATTGGDLRIAATARIHLARTLRGAGDEARRGPCSRRTTAGTGPRVGATAPCSPAACWPPCPWSPAPGRRPSRTSHACSTRPGATRISRPRPWPLTPSPTPPPPAATRRGRRGCCRRRTACMRRSGTPWTTPTGSTRGSLAKLRSDGDDDLALGVALDQLAHRLGNLVQRVARADVGDELAGLQQLPQGLQVVLAAPWRPASAAAG